MRVDHWDFNGKNIMISEEGNLYVIDFGVARHDGKGDTHPDLANALDLFLDCLESTLPSNPPITGKPIKFLIKSNKELPPGMPDWVASLISKGFGFGDHQQHNAAELLNILNITPSEMYSNSIHRPTIPIPTRLDEAIIEH
ncbi:hypothetical protein LSAT2_016144 [Lamellibrachia satsuma]|nr:hypothetical protein LSAT2_016144 [Lamellibrachia satsuma]